LALRKLRFARDTTVPQTGCQLTSAI